MNLDALEAMLGKATPGEWSKTLHEFHNALTTDARPSRVYNDEIAPQVRTQEDCDLIAAMHNALPELIAAARRWDAFCNLWAASTELCVRQDEEGTWSILQVEPVDEVFGILRGETPDAAIDSAIAARKEGAA